jgi:hypothetical protein
MPAEINLWAALTIAVFRQLPEVAKNIIVFQCMAD